MNQRPQWGPPGGQGMPQGNFSPRPPPQHMQRFLGPSPHNRFGSPRGPSPRQGGFMPRGGGPQSFNGPSGNMAPGNINHARPRHQMQNHSPQPSHNFGPGRFQGPPMRAPNNGRALFPSPESYGRFQPPEFGIPNGPPPRQNFSPRSDMMRPGMMRGPSPMNHQPRSRFNFPHSGNNQGPKQAKKAKIDKRDLPENNQYFCDICDKGFKLEEKYKEHVDSHQKCKYEGCNYVAAPKLVQLHVNLQHKSGLAKKIWSLESEEDIKKWREERKKNFPTAENIEKKKAVDAERVARGEVIEEKYFGKIRQRGKGRFDRGRGRGRGQGQERSSPEVAKETKRGFEGSADTDASLAKKPKLDGAEAKPEDKAQEVNPEADPLAFFYNAIGSDFDTDSEEEGVARDKPVEISSREVTAAGALGSLITSYGDEAGESDDGNAEGAEQGVSIINNLNNGGNDNGESQRFIQEAVTTMRTMVQEPILSSLRHSPWYSILIDETTDIAVIKEMIVYARYLKNGVSQTEFISITPLHDGKADSIVTAILDLLQQKNIPLNKLCSLGSDGAAVMVGKKNGVGAKLREHVPHLISNHCVAHRLALAVGEAAKGITYLTTFKDILDQLHRFYKYSSVQMDALHQIEAKDVRWLSHDQATVALRKDFKSVLTSLWREDRERNDIQAMGLSVFLHKYQFIASLMMMSDVLPHMSALSKTMQKRDAVYTTVKPLVKGTISIISRLLTIPGDFFCSTRETMKNLIAEGFLLKMPTQAQENEFMENVYKKFLQNVIENLENRFPDLPLLEDFGVFDMTDVSEDVIDDHGSNEIVLLAKEIRKERNEILQCVYHIVQHNFFEEKRKVTHGTECNTKDGSSTGADSAVVMKSSETDADSVAAENNCNDNMVGDVQSETSCR